MRDEAPPTLPGLPWTSDELITDATSRLPATLKKRRGLAGFPK